MNIHHAEQTQQQPSKVIRFTVVAAMFAAFFAAGWVMQYLLTTEYGVAYFMRPLSMFVFGQAYGMDGKGGDMLFVIVTRFILGFGCLWLPIAGAMAGLSKLFNNRSAPEKAEFVQPQVEKP